MIYDQCGVIERLSKEIVKKPEIEHCALAVADVESNLYETKHYLTDYCMLEDVGGKTTDSLTSIPREISFVLLRHCKRSNKAPVVLHTHIMGYEYSDPLWFSPQDMRYINQFIKFANAALSLSDALFIVMNGKTLVYCWEDATTSELRFGEELRLNE